MLARCQTSQSKDEPQASRRCWHRRGDSQGFASTKAGQAELAGCAHESEAVLKVRGAVDREIN
jgi:hypothetical protein